MRAGERLGILGGTLDPVHLGHLETALAARDALTLDRILVVASHVPPHRSQQPHASGFHRFAMVALALNGIDRLQASDAELSAPGPSYTAETLERFHAEGYRAWQLFFIIGADAFAEIETWRRYPHVLDLAHFVVVSRPGFDLRAVAARRPELGDRIRTAPYGSTGGPQTSVYVVPAATPDVSSTEIRRRLRAGEPITGMVSDPVEQHIRQHHLYLEDVPSGLIHSTADQLHGKD